MKNFLIKLVANGLIVVAALLLLTNANFWESLVTAIVLTVLAYLIGDLFILPKTNNVVATISDAVLAALVLWVAASVGDWDLSVGELLLTVVILGAFEYWFHTQVLHDMGIHDQDKTNAPT